MRSPRSALWLCGLLVAACGDGGNFLEGSISKRFDLGFDYVEVGIQEEAVVIQYQDDIEYSDVAYEATNTVLELIVERFPAPGEAGEWLDVLDRVELNRYILFMPEKYVIQQDERRFPEAIEAELVFFEFGRLSGRTVAGQFRVVFADGSTIRGGFSAALP